MHNVYYFSCFRSVCITQDINRFFLNLRFTHKKDLLNGIDIFILLLNFYKLEKKKTQMKNLNGKIC